MNDIHPAAGIYYPAVPGARIIADSQPLYIDGERVSAVVDEDGGYTVFIGGEIAVGGQLDGTEGDLMTFFAAEALVAGLEATEALVAGLEVDEAAVAEAVNPEAVYAAAAAEVRAHSAWLARQADLAAAEQPARVHGREMSMSDPRHPANRATSLRRDALRLTCWTVADEIGYREYVSEGIGDTDGHFAPLDRSAWKATLDA